MGGKETINYNIHDYQNALELALPPLSVSIFKHQSKE
jgi:1,4-alpha-glucan branching enzyme